MNHEAEKQITPVKTVSGFKKFMRKFVPIGIATTLLGGVGYAAWQNDMIPSIHRTIDVPPSFDNKADEQIIKVGANTVTVSQDQLPNLMKDSIKPVVKGEYPDISLLLPVKLNSNQSVTESTYYLDVYNWMTGGNKTEHMALGKEFIIPNKGTEIIVPIEDAEIFQLTPRKLNSDLQPFFSGILIRFKGPDKTPYELLITAQKSLMPMEILNQAPLIGENGFYVAGFNQNPELKGLPLPAGTSIIKTSQDNAHVYFALGTSASKISNLNVDSASGIGFNFDLLTIKDNGNEKIAVIAP